MAKFRRGTPGDTFATFPTRRFALLIDPIAFKDLGSQKKMGVIFFIRDLAALESPIEITLIWPTDLDGVSPGRVDATLTHLLGSHLEEIVNPEGVPEFTPNVYMADDARQALSGDTPEQKRRRSLLAIADHRQVDGLITNDPVFVDWRYDLLQHHRIRIVPVSESADLVEVCAHGHSVFWSTENAERRLTIDVYYPMSHWKQRRLANWYWSKQQHLAQGDLRDNVHSALINRYALIAYARDMVRFYELQLDYYHRRGLWGAFGTLIGYHMTNFYLYLWGLLEQLTLIANYVKGLALPERACGILSQQFWIVFGDRDPVLRRHMTEGMMREWIATMADARHAAAHRAMLLPKYIVSETEESQKTDAEISAILRKEEPGFYRLFPHDLVRVFEPQKIAHWRHWKRRTVATNAVVVKKESGGYIRLAVMSIDHDLEMLNAAIDAFLVRLFNPAPEAAYRFFDSGPHAP